MSLLYLIQGLDQSKYKPVVACIHNAPAVLDLYRAQNIETIYWPGIKPFEHTTLGWFQLYNPLALKRLLEQLWYFSPSARATQRLVESVRPDLVHLNSLVLAPSAMGVKRTGVPLIWHVREPVHPGHFGLRRAFLRYKFLKWADEGIFISDFDRQQLTRGSKGIVVHNFVDFARFDRTLSGEPARAELGLSLDAKVILFLGGRSPVKGIFPLLEAMPTIRAAVPEVHLLVAGGAYHSSRRMVSRIARRVLPLLGTGTIAQRVDQLIARHDLANCVHLLEWRADIPALLTASDVLVFPSTEPHFARPVIEAGAMAKPVVASRIGGVEELVEDGATGLLVPPKDPAALADAVIRLLRDPVLARQMGEAGYAQAQARFSQAANVQATVAVYERLGSVG